MGYNIACIYNCQWVTYPLESVNAVHKLITFPLFDTFLQVPVLILSEDPSSQVILTPQTLHEITARQTGSLDTTSDLWPLKRPREFVEKILLFLSRLQTTDV